MFSHVLNFFIYLQNTFEVYQYLSIKNVLSCVGIENQNCIFLNLFLYKIKGDFFGKKSVFIIWDDSIIKNIAPAYKKKTQGRVWLEINQKKHYK